MLPETYHEMAECPYCEKQVVICTMRIHQRSCKKLPLASGLVAILDEDSMMTVSGLCQRFGVGHKVVANKLLGTIWTKEKLLARGRQVSGKKARIGRKKYDQRKKASTEPRCFLCGIVGLALCGFCKGKLKAFENGTPLPRSWSTALAMAKQDGRVPKKYLRLTKRVHVWEPADGV